MGTLPIALSREVDDSFEEVKHWLEQSHPELSIVCWDDSADCTPASAKWLSDHIAASFLDSPEKRRAWRGVVLFESTSVRGPGDWHYRILYHLDSVHAIPTFVNLVDDAILKSADEGKSLSLQTRSRSYPTPPETKQFSFSSSGIYVAIAFAM